MFLKLRLPNWCKMNKRDGFLEIDPARAYPHFLTKLKITEPTQYWVEVARRCATTELRDIVRAVDKSGEIVKVRIINRPEWKLTEFPPGGGADEGALNFRTHYQSIS